MSSISCAQIDGITVDTLTDEQLYADATRDHGHVITDKTAGDDDGTMIT
jgi:hypothetical protein